MYVLTVVATDDRITIVIWYTEPFDCTKR